MPSKAGAVLMEERSLSRNRRNSEHRREEGLEVTQMDVNIKHGSETSCHPALLSCHCCCVTGAFGLVWLLVVMG